MLIADGNCGDEEEKEEKKQRARRVEVGDCLAEPGVELNPISQLSRPPSPH